MSLETLAKEFVKSTPLTHSECPERRCQEYVYRCIHPGQGNVSFRRGIIDRTAYLLRHRRGGIDYGSAVLRRSATQQRSMARMP